MIGSLKGTVIQHHHGSSVIETSSGVGYRVRLSPQMVSNYPVGSSIFVLTHLHVREDCQDLFGFESVELYDMFLLLRTVSGVGPKTAFTIISFGSVIELTQAVVKNNVTYFSDIPGIGKKTALKIILELSQKMKQHFQLDKFTADTKDDKIVVDALVSLGYTATDAKQRAGKTDLRSSVEERIREALRVQ